MPELGDGSAESLRLPTDDAGDEDSFYGDQDGAQHLMQPAISPVASRLASPRTPAAEKAAALDQLPGGGLFQLADEPRGPDHLLEAPQHPSPALPGGPGGPAAPRPDTVVAAQGDPAGPREPAAGAAGPDTTPAGSVDGAQVRQRRSSSMGENALRKLSKAFPSINIPTGFFPSISSPSFLSSNSPSQREGPPLPRPSQTAPRITTEEGRPRDAAAGARACLTRTASDRSLSRLERPPSAASRRAAAGTTLSRSTSDDSMLHRPLSRVPSFGDDERWTNIREQVNVRFKAIRDSWDGPSFKLSHLPNIIPENLKKGPYWPSNGPAMAPSRSGSQRSSQKTSRDPASSLDAVLESLSGDIVVMGGYRGSILRSSQAPYRQLWVPVKVGLNMRKVNMEVGLDPEDEENMEDHIFASGMLQHIGPVDISRRLFKKLRECENARKGKLRVHDFGYDWRLSPHLLSRKLIEFLEKLPSNHPSTPAEGRGAWVIAHSLGGLITRHAVNQRPEIFAGVVFAGAPQRCVNVLGPLRNGDAVLLNEKVLTAQVNFSLRTTYAFLPEDGFCFVDRTTQEELRIDFFDVDDWIRYRLSPCVSEGPPAPLARSNTFGSLRNLSGSFSGLPLRGRTNSEAKKASSSSSSSPPRAAAAATATAVDPARDRTLAPQMGGGPQYGGAGTEETSPAARARNVAYLKRTLAEVKRFRAELAHRADHQAANAYPPLAVIYSKDTPTVWAARVSGREGIAAADAYDDLVFRSGDGVVLAREAMLPAGYESVRGGRVGTLHGHITMLGDLAAVGRALGAVVRGRGRGTGLGEGWSDGPPRGGRD